MSLIYLVPLFFHEKKKVLGFRLRLRMQDQRDSIKISATVLSFLDGMHKLHDASIMR